MKSKKIKSNTFQSYFDYFNRLPDFINTKSPSNKVIWEQMYAINDNIFLLFGNECLSNRKLYSIHNTNCLYLEIIDDIMTTSHVSIGPDIHSYYKDIFISFMGIAEVNEEFEIAANLKNYYDNYIK